MMKSENNNINSRPAIMISQVSSASITNFAYDRLPAVISTKQELMTSSYTDKATQQPICNDIVQMLLGRGVIFDPFIQQKTRTLFRYR